MQLFAGVVLANNYLLGLDVGTSAVKALFIDPDTNQIFKDEAKIVTHDKSPEVEQNANDYLDAIKAIAIRNEEKIKHVSAIGLSGHTPSVVCVDESGTPVFPVLIWQDNRATKEADELKARYGNPLPVIGTSLPWAASACPAKLFWLSRHHPDVVKKTRWVLQPKDYVGFHLTGSAISDAWSTKGLCNTQTLKPTTELLSHIGWSDSVVPELRDGYQSRGNITSHGAARTGLPEGIPVSTGWSDAMCGMLALGVMTTPTSFVITGTSAIVGSSHQTDISDAGSLYVIPKACAPLTVTYGPTQMSGGSIAWAAKLFGVSENEIVSEGAQDDGETAPIFLPYIKGERAPLWRNDIEGRFVNINTTHVRSSFARATMEGISLAERQVLEIAEEINHHRAEKVVLGGHAGNDARWERIRARTIGRKILRYEDGDTTTRGASMLAHAMSVGLEKAVSDLSINPVATEPTDSEKKYSQRVYKEFLTEQRELLATADRKLGS